MSSASPAPGPGAWRWPTRPRPLGARSSSGAAMTPGCAPSQRHVGATGCLASIWRRPSRRHPILRSLADATRFWWRRRLRRAARSRCGWRRAPGSAALVTCAKGIERGTHAFMTEVLAEAAPGRRRAILSGPSFAADVAAGLPTAVTLACADEEPGARAMRRAARADLATLSFDRCSRRRDRRRGEERAGDRLRRRRRPRAWRERGRRAHRPRLRRASPLRRGFRGAGIDADGPLGIGRSCV